MKVNINLIQKWVNGVIGGIGICILLGAFGNFISGKVLFGSISTITGILLLPIVFDKFFSFRVALILKIITFLIGTALGGMLVPFYYVR